jgi:hypothetical protein
MCDINKFYVGIAIFKRMRHHVVILDLKLTQTHKLLLYLPQVETSFYWEYPLGLDPEDVSRIWEVMRFEPAAQQPRQLSFEAPAMWLRNPLAVLTGNPCALVTLETCRIRTPFPLRSVSCHQNWNIPYTRPHFLLQTMNDFSCSFMHSTKSRITWGW